MHLIINIYFFNLKGPVATPTYGHYNFLFFKKVSPYLKKRREECSVDRLNSKAFLIILFYLIQ
jgi:hypothetical protein